jgi:heme/copper-type cytochrome/quinol oxidase subunit 4
VQNHTNVRNRCCQQQWQQQQQRRQRRLRCHFFKLFVRLSGNFRICFTSQGILKLCIKQNILHMLYWIWVVPGRLHVWTFGSVWIKVVPGRLHVCCIGSEWFLDVCKN